MLSPEQIDQAAQHLMAARKADTPGPSIPEACRPDDVDAALADVVGAAAADIVGRLGEAG